MEGGVTCPHCTFVNGINRHRCAMCLKMIRKRDRSQASDVIVDKYGTSSGVDAASKASDAASRLESEGSVTDTRTTVAATSLRFRPPFASLRDTASPQPNITEEAMVKPTTPYVSSLFATAAGVPVLISETLLQQARLKFSQEAVDSNEGDEVEGKSSTHTVSQHQDKVHDDTQEAYDDGERGGQIDHRAAKGVEQWYTPPDGSVTGDKDSIGDEVNTAACVATTTGRGCAIQMPVSSTLLPQSSLRAGHRRGFIPPQRTVVANQPQAAKQLPNSTAASRPPAGRTLGTAVQFVPQVHLSSSKADMVSFDYAHYTSRATASVPPIECLVSGQFCFDREDLSRSFCDLLQLGDADTRVEVRHWWRMLQRLGANGNALGSTMWCAAVLTATLLQVRELHVRASTTGAPHSIFSPTTVALCLCAKYNCEAVMGHRPALRSLLEGDVPVASLMVLQFLSVCEERGPPHTRIVCLSDGHYCFKASFDVPLSNLLRERVILPGQKVAICGAKGLLHGQCSPAECGERVVLGVNYNCVRAVSEDTPLGLCLTEPAPLSIHLVHPLGGLVPAMQGVVARVLPPFFVTTEVMDAKDAEKQAGGAVRRPVRGGTKVVRNLHAQIQCSDGATCIAAEAANGVANATLAGEKRQNSVACVTSILLASEGAEALVQQWRSDASGETVAPVEEEDLPAEGSTIVVYALNPSRFQTATAPFTHAKLFYSARNLHFVLKQPCMSYHRDVFESIAAAKELRLGGVVDLVGTFLGWCQTGQGTFLLLIMRDETYALLQVPLPAKGRVLSLPIPSVAGTPVVLQNCTFLCYEDSVAGSDCAKVLANEYTRLIQRPAQAYLRELISNLASRSMQLKSMSKKYEARMREIFRCLAEAASSDTPETATPVTEDGVMAMSAAEELAGRASLGVNAFETPLDVGNGGALNLASPKVPYYMRQLVEGDNAATTVHPRSTGGVVLGGVPLTRPSPLHPRCTQPNRIPSESNPAATAFHWYGNITDLVLHECAPDGDGERLDLLGDLNHSMLEAWRGHECRVRRDHRALAAGMTASAGQCIVRDVEIELGWRYAAGMGDVMRARTRRPTVVEAVLQGCVDFESFCAKVREAHGDTESAAQRKAVILRWSSTTPTVNLWWQFCTTSYITSGDDSANQVDLASETQCGLPWLQEEWVTAVRILRAHLARTLFKFTVHGESSGELVAAYRISDHCSVTDLF